MAESPVPTKPVLVIFDLVATIADAGPRYVKAFEEVCREKGYPVPAHEEIVAALGNKSLSQITEALIGTLDPDKKEAFMAACNNTCDAMLNRADWHEALYPHAREAILELHKKGIAMGVFTSTREDAMESQLAYHGLGDIFPARLRRGKDNVRDKDKASDALKAEQMRSIIDQFKRDAGCDDVSVVVIGDSSADFMAADKLGLSFIGFAVNEAKKEQLKTAGVKNTIEDFKGLTEAIDRIVFFPVNDNKDMVKKDMKGKKHVF